MKTDKYLKFVLGISILFAWFGCSEMKNHNNEIHLWPEIEPFQTGYLKVSDIHEIYYELCGNPDGIPVFVIHGGPGAGCSPKMRQYFNPEKYLIVLHDQRGCGKSKPNAELRENNTQQLVSDIEQLRVKLNLDKIILFGGSWGSALSLAYAESYPENIKAMVLRGIYLATNEEDDLYYKMLTNYFPELAQQLIESLPDSMNELNNSNLYKLFRAEDENERNKYIKLFEKLGFKALGLHVKDSVIEEYVNSEENFQEIYTMNLIAFHYFTNNCYLEEGQLLRDVGKIPDIPVDIVHGRYDMVCFPATAYKLHKSIPGSTLKIVEEAGHSLFEKPIEEELVKAMKELEAISN
ncbi:MAG: prolyl aminopeptidase [Bacteroidales bacterium]|nr:prolyl aminopeptidase [Bacteroidales bacterium]